MFFNSHAKGSVCATNVGAERINPTSKLVDNTGTERQGTSVLVREVIFECVDYVNPPYVSVQLSKDSTTMQRFFEIDLYRLNAKKWNFDYMLKRSLRFFRGRRREISVKKSRDDIVQKVFRIAILHEPI